MKKLFFALAAASLVGCQSIDRATVSSGEITGEGGEAVAVVQATALGFTALFHLIDIVQSDLDVVVNRLLVTEAKAMGATKVNLLTANTTPRNGIWRIFTVNGTGLNILAFPGSQAVGVAVR